MKRTGALLRGHCVFVLVAMAACGGDPAPEAPDAAVIEPDAEIAPDAMPPLDACGAVAGTIDGPGGSYSGTLAATDGADFNVEMGECANEVSWFTEAWLDDVVAVTGLTPGSSYTVTLTSVNDLAVYVAGTCDADGPATGACLGFTDRVGGNIPDVALFEAPANGIAYVIVDSFNEKITGDGTYAIAIGTPGCETEADCGGGVCYDYQCADCLSSFDCSADAPLCSTTQECVAGGAACVDDDVADADAGGDDGPTAATAIALPVAGTPTTATAAVCSSPAAPREEDWFTFTTTAAATWSVAATWADTAADIDLQVVDAAGATIVSGVGTAPGSEPVLTPSLLPGTYYVRVYRYAPMNSTASTPYTLALAVPECTTAFQCTTAAEPACVAGQCIAGPDACVSDDAADVTGDDDGPSGATVLTSGVPTEAAICNSPTSEFDFYAIDVAQSGTLTATLEWDTTTLALQLVVFDSTGFSVGAAFYQRPNVVTVGFLPAGRYYARVRRAGTATTTVEPYNLTLTAGVGAACTGVTDCASIYQTQTFRGSCVAGACEKIAANEGAPGALCDTPDDCASDLCSYVTFEADAAESACTNTCTTITDCAPLGADFRCSTGTVTKCMPSCASDLDCGALSASAAIDVGQLWNYGTCDVPSGVCAY